MYRLGRLDGADYVEILILVRTRLDSDSCRLQPRSITNVWSFVFVCCCYQLFCVIVVGVTATTNIPSIIVTSAYYSSFVAFEIFGHWKTECPLDRSFLMRKYSKWIRSPGSKTNAGMTLLVTDAVIFVKARKAQTQRCEKTEDNIIIWNTKSSIIYYRSTTETKPIKTVHQS